MRIRIHKVIESGSGSTTLILRKQILRSITGNQNNLQIIIMIIIFDIFFRCQLYFRQESRQGTEASAEGALREEQPAHPRQDGN
jgi:hypothetical protein